MKGTHKKELSIQAFVSFLFTPREREKFSEECLFVLTADGMVESDLDFRSDENFQV